MTRLDHLMMLRTKLQAECDALRSNAHKAGKEGAGTHRNAGDAGRVADIYARKLAELKAVQDMIAQEEAKT